MKWCKRGCEAEGCQTQHRTINDIMKSGRGAKLRIQKAMYEIQEGCKSEDRTSE